MRDTSFLSLSCHVIDMFAVIIPMNIVWTTNLLINPKIGQRPIGLSSMFPEPNHHDLIIQSGREAEPLQNSDNLPIESLDFPAQQVCCFDAIFCWSILSLVEFPTFHATILLLKVGFSTAKWINVSQHAPKSPKNMNSIWVKYLIQDPQRTINSYGSFLK